MKRINYWTTLNEDYPKYLHMKKPHPFRDYFCKDQTLDSNLFNTCALGPLHPIDYNTLKNALKINKNDPEITQFVQMIHQFQHIAFFITNSKTEVVENFNDATESKSKNIMDTLYLSWTPYVILGVIVLLFLNYYFNNGNNLNSLVDKKVDNSVPVFTMTNDHGVPVSYKITDLSTPI